MEIKSLENTGFDTLFEAFNAAFAGYEVQLNKSELQTMLKRRGFNPALSFAAFDGDKIVSFTCNGTGDYNGVKTAYDTGTGTLEAYRGNGLATQIFETSIPYLREAGIKEYLLWKWCVALLSKTLLDSIIRIIALNIIIIKCTDS